MLNASVTQDSVISIGHNSPDDVEECPSVDRLSNKPLHERKGKLKRMYRK